MTTRRSWSNTWIQAGVGDIQFYDNILHAGQHRAHADRLSDDRWRREHCRRDVRTTPQARYRGAVLSAGFDTCRQRVKSAAVDMIHHHRTKPGQPQPTQHPLRLRQATRDLRSDPGVPSTDMRRGASVPRRLLRRQAQSKKAQGQRPKAEPARPHRVLSSPVLAALWHCVSTTGFSFRRLP